MKVYSHADSDNRQKQEHEQPLNQNQTLNRTLHLPINAQDLESIQQLLRTSVYSYGAAIPIPLAILQS
jgi:hypothetical protein